MAWSRPSPHSSSLNRRFGLLTIALIILVFGLARWEVSIMLIGLIVTIALIVLVIYYQTANRRDL